MTRARFVAATVLAMLAGATPELAAAQRSGEDPEGAQIRVVNNFVSQVRVYAEDARGRLHPLGRVARGHLGAFSIPEDVARLGDFRVRVYPSDPIGSWVVEETGIKTQPLHLAEDGSVTVWLETNLAASIVEIATG